jgi:hypothetical protein
MLLIYCLICSRSIIRACAVHAKEGPSKPAMTSFNRYHHLIDSLGIGLYGVSSEAIAVDCISRQIYRMLQHVDRYHTYRPIGWHRHCVGNITCRRHITVELYIVLAQMSELIALPIRERQKSTLQKLDIL